MTIVSLGDIADVSLSTGGTTADPAQAQMLAAVGHPAGTVESESGVSASVAQMYTHRHETR